VLVFPDHQQDSLTVPRPSQLSEFPVQWKPYVKAKKVALRTGEQLVTIVMTSNNMTTISKHNNVHLTIKCKPSSSSSSSSVSLLAFFVFLCLLRPREAVFFPVGFFSVLKLYLSAFTCSLRTHCMLHLRAKLAVQQITSNVHLIETEAYTCHGQGDHSPDNMKFPDGLLHSCLCIKCYSYHAGIVSGGSRNATVHESKTKMKCTSSAVKNGCKYAANNKQF